MGDIKGSKKTSEKKQFHDDEDGTRVPSTTEYTSNPLYLITRHIYVHPLLFALLALYALVFHIIPGARHWIAITTSTTSAASRPKFKEDTAYGWKDDIWPIREQTPWDISTDFPAVRKMVYEVEEGTWLRLNVGPNGDIVFDMLGDIYCISSDDVASSSYRTVQAHAIIQGVPYDSDPQISPDGTQLAFRSDAGLGIANIWTIPWSGCHDTAAGRLYSHLSFTNPNVVETPEMKRHRLVQEGRAHATKVTNETFRWVSDARWHPDCNKLIATKWYTSSRTLPAGEGWLYELPDSAAKSSSSITARDGLRLVGRTLPPGWSPEQYGDQQIGPEQFVWWGTDRLIYSKNVADSNGRFEYSKDVYKGIYAIFSYNVTSGVTETLIDATPGGASRPEISHDGRTLAFVRRVRDKEALVLKDLQSGTIRNIWYGLTYDLSIISAPMGTYPSFSFTPEDDAIIIWAAGSLWTVPLSVDSSGERIAGGEPWKIKWKATIVKRLAETRLSETDIAKEEARSRQRIHALTELSVDETGDRVIFRAGAKTYWQALSHTGLSPKVDPISIRGDDFPEAIPLPVLHPNATYYSPFFIPNEPNLIIHARWSDTFFSSLEIADIARNVSFEVDGLPLGRYDKPVICECSGSNRRIAFVRKGGDGMTGDIVATAAPGLYVGSLTLPLPFGHSQGTKLRVRDLKRISKNIPAGKMKFTEGASKLLVFDGNTASIIDLSAAPDDDSGEYPTRDLVRGRMSTEIAVTPPRSSDLLRGVKTRLAPASVGYVAFIDYHQVYMADGVHVGERDYVWSKPGPNATHGLARVSVDGGHDISWSRDGKRLFWLLGPYLHSLEISKLGECKKAIRQDKNAFGIDCVKTLLDVQEISVTYEHERARIKNAAMQAFAAENPHGGKDMDEKYLTSDILVIKNATVVSMITGTEERDVLYGCTIVVRDGVIVQHCNGDVKGVPGAKVIDAQGGIVVPGFVDVHAHWEGQDTVASSWEQRTFLAYGCTTVHNPSIDTVTTWTERARVESGNMIGPRIFHTGTIIYGGTDGEYHQDIVDMDEARSALVRLKVEGGPYSFSYKNYQLPARASRQRLIKAAKELGMNVYPEGGMNFDWDMTYILDGMTTVEHSIPIPVVYKDVLTLFAKSGTGNTPTHVVNYGGIWGEIRVWAHTAVPFNEKLREFVPHAVLESISTSLSVPKDAYQLFNTSASVKEMTKMGLNANIGAHGEPPLGLNYHKEMWFFSRGGMTPYEVLRSATRQGALSLGLFGSIGSLEPGKLADMVIYPPGLNVLEEISLSSQIRYVVKGGRVWEAGTMKEEWPEEGREQGLPPLNTD
ncbi:hypothetical protein FRB94_011212 [Tulasnella sp. JGI-2019a]|nr:hypothetical protein FRB93_005064 [Tulasnella sp. JGI-2019a]KAG8992887.1 hypothetical protein FRB94_011212 [Tulasnella sp. JGI-2019a]